MKMGRVNLKENTNKEMITKEKITKMEINILKDQMANIINTKEKGKGNMSNMKNKIKNRINKMKRSMIKKKERNIIRDSLQLNSINITRIRHRMIMIFLTEEIFYTKIY